MDNPRETDNLDALIDSALSTYASPMPRAGLESRVLAHIHAGPKRARSFWAASTLAAAAGVAVALVWLHPADAPNAPELRRETIVIAKTEPARVAPAPPPPSLRKQHRLAASHVGPDTPKPPFPTPSPLTAEERALLRLVASHPEVVTQPLAQPAPIEPLHIEPLSDSNSTED